MKNLIQIRKSLSLKNLFPSQVEWFAIIIVLGILAAIAIPRYARFEYFTQRRIKKSAIDLIYEGLNLGSAAAAAPSQMELGDTKRVYLYLSLEKSIEDLKKFLPDEYTKVGDIVKVSDRMSGKLTGPDFVINSVSPETVAILTNNTNFWTWMIKPLKEGDLELSVTLSCLVEINSHPTPISINTFDKKVNVYVAPKNKFVSIFKSIISTYWPFFVALIGLIGSVILRHKKNR